MLKIDGFDSALIGIATVWQKSGKGAERLDTLIYNGDTLVNILMADSGMGYEEALEYISYNIEGAYVGNTTPIIVWPCTMQKVDELAADLEDKQGE
jgi:hypothetical protein